MQSLFKQFYVRSEATQKSMLRSSTDTQREEVDWNGLVLELESGMPKKSYGAVK